MSETLTPSWEDALRVIQQSITPKSFRRELAAWKRDGGRDPDAFAFFQTAVLAEYFVSTAGLFAMLFSPPGEASAALAEVREALATCDFESTRKQLKRGERRYYDAFAKIAAPLFAQTGEAMEALFNCYLAGDYDPQADPDALIAEALETAEEDLPRAQHQVTRAGAIALHGQSMWWQWEDEAWGPAGPWLWVICRLVNSYTYYGESPLGPPEEARQKAKAEAQSLHEHETPDTLAEPVTPSAIDELIEELIERGEAPLTEEQRELCRTHRDEAVAALIDLATDEGLQAENAPGEGYAPIRAVNLLGEMQAVEAIRALLDIVADAEWDEIICSAAIYALREIGPPVLDPVLKFMRYSQNVEAKTALAELLSEFGEEDEQIYQVLLATWEEVTWDAGKAILAPALARTGGKQAIPRLQQALRDPGLHQVDYNTIAEALEDLGIEVPRPMFDAKMATRVLGGLDDPEYFYECIQQVPKRWRGHPKGVAHFYVYIQERVIRIVLLTVVTTALSKDPEPIAWLLEVTEGLSFDAPTKGLPRWVRRAYTSLGEEPGERLRHYLLGMLLPLHSFLSSDYDIAEEPNRLIAAARDLAPEEEARRLFGQAGALALRGGSLWSRWPAEAGMPLSSWLMGLQDLRQHLEELGQIPLRLVTMPSSDEMAEMFMESKGKEEMPPRVAELLDHLIEWKQDTLPLAHRRRFARHRATVIPHLIEIVEDPSYRHVDGPGEGWPAILAAHLLGELKAMQAADALAGVVAETSPGDVVHDAALFSLMALGPSAAQAIQLYFRYGRDIQTKVSLAEVLGHVGRRDPESFLLMRQVWETTEWAQNRRMVALAFGDLGDRRAIPSLQETLEDPRADALDREYIRWALLKLGASTSPPPQAVSTRLRAPAPHNPRLIYDESDRPRRLEYTVWGEPLCPDCGGPMAMEEDGDFVHLP